MKKALLAGATGLVGNELLGVLLSSNQYKEVIVISRKPLNWEHEKLKTVLVKDFADIRNQAEKLKADDVFCCLGTTMKKAGSKEDFERVDYEYPMLLATIAKNNNAKQFLLVSAKGASVNSFFYYNKVKGKLEQELQGMNFQQLKIFRPSLLLGDRQERRAGEDIAKVISQKLPFLYAGPMKQYSPIHAKEVATGMHKAAQLEDKKVCIYESEEIKKL